MVRRGTAAEMDGARHRRADGGAEKVGKEKATAKVETTVGMAKARVKAKAMLAIKMGLTGVIPVENKDMAAGAVPRASATYAERRGISDSAARRGRKELHQRERPARVQPELKRLRRSEGAGAREVTGPGGSPCASPNDQTSRREVR